MAFKKAPAALCRQLINLGEFQPRSFATKAKVDPTKKVSAAFKGGGQPSKSSAKETKGEQSADKRFQMMLKVLAPAEIIPKQHTPEEQAEASRRFKDYSRKKMAQHRAWQKDLSRKYELVQIALAALPLGLREAALVPDNTPFPLNRQIATHTPPVKGYELTARDNNDKGKI